MTNSVDSRATLSRHQRAAMPDFQNFTAWTYFHKFVHATSHTNMFGLLRSVEVSNLRGIGRYRQLSMPLSSSATVVRQMRFQTRSKPVSTRSLGVRSVYTSIVRLDYTSGRPSRCQPCQNSPSSTPSSTRMRSTDSLPLVENLPPTRSLGFWTDLPTWRRSSINTLHCLVGCSIGDLSALFVFANYFPEASMAVVMPVAMASGIVSSTLLETFRLKYTMPVIGWRRALNTALNMSFLSMLTMEAAENATNVLLAQTLASSGSASMTEIHTAVGSTSDIVPSLATMLMMDVQNPYFLPSIILSTLAGFLAPLPYNYFIVRKYNKRCH